MVITISDAHDTTQADARSEAQRKEARHAARSQVLDKRVEEEPVGIPKE